MNPQSFIDWLSNMYNGSLIKSFWLVTSKSEFSSELRQLLFLAKGFNSQIADNRKEAIQHFVLPCYSTVY